MPKDSHKTKAQLIDEVGGLRRRIAELEGAATTRHTHGASPVDGAPSYRAVFESVPSSIVLVDTEGRILDISQHHVDEIGRGKTSKANYIGKNVMQHPSVVAAGLADEYRSVLEGKELHQAGVWFPTSTGGAELYCDVSGVPLTGDNGDVTGAVFVHHDVTDRIQAENATRMEKEFTDSALDTQLDTFFLFEPTTGKAIRWNKAFSDLTGFTDEEIAEMPAPYSYYGSADLERAGEFVQRVIAEGSGTIELDLICKDGRKVPTEYRVSVLPSEAGEPTHIISIGRDISERKRAYEELRLSHQLSDDLLKSIPSGIYIYDFEPPDTLILVYANKEAEAIAGAKLDQWKGREFDEIWPEAKGLGITDAYLEVARTGIPFETENLVYSDEKLDAVLRVRVFMLPNQRLASAFEDITERKRAEERLLFTQYSVDKTSDAIYWMGPDAELIYVNDAACSSLGYSRDELLKMKVHDFDPQFPADDWPAHWADLKERKSFLVESSHRTKDGRVFPVEIAVNLLVSGGQEFNVAVARNISERKRAEEELHESRQQYQMLFTTMPDGFALHEVICDENDIPVDYRFLEVNPGFEALTGLRASDVVGKTLLEALPGSEASWIERYGRVALTGEPIEFEQYSRVLDRYYHVIAFCPRHRQFAVLFTDVTDRMRSEAMLRESEEKHKEMIANISDVIAIMSADGVIKYKSPNIERWFGWKPADLVGTNGWDTVHPADLDRIQQEFFDLLGEDNATTSVEYRYKCKDGGYKTIALTAVNLTNDSIVDGVLMNYHDVTERRKAEAGLRQSEERFQTFLDIAVAAIEIYEPNGDLKLVNDAWARFWNLSKEDVVGFNIFDDPQCETTGLTPAFREAQIGRTRVIPETLYDPDKSGFVGGRKRWISPRMYPILDEGGNAQNIVLIYDDVTDRKEAEEERELLEEQLRHSQKMEAIGQLAAGVAHDFNNLLTVIGGYTGLIGLKGANATAEDLALWSGQVMKAQESAAALTQQLLAFGRRDVTQPREIVANNVVEDIQKMLQRLLGSRFELDVVLGQQAGIVHADPGQLTQILINLVINARDSMPDGGRVTLKTTRVRLEDALQTDTESIPPGDYVVFRVIDTGCGMNETTLAHIFEPFFTTKPVGSGTGLGLSVVYGIVHQHHGCIGVVSRVGLGTTFSVYLPRVEAPAEPSLSRSGIFENLNGTETVLVVDDHEDVRSLVSMVIDDLGYTVLTAPDGEAALALAEESDFVIHLLLTDIIMPGMTGQELADRLTVKRPETQVLFMTAYADETTQSLAPSDRLIQKPFKPEVLARELRKVLESSP